MPCSWWLSSMRIHSQWKEKDSISLYNKFQIKSSNSYRKYMTDFPNKSFIGENRAIADKSLKNLKYLQNTSSGHAISCDIFQLLILFSKGLKIYRYCPTLFLRSKMENKSDKIWGKRSKYFFGYFDQFPQAFGQFRTSPTFNLISSVRLGFFSYVHLFMFFIPWMSSLK